MPDLSGQVAGHVTLRGQLTEPDIQLDLRADQLAWLNEATIRELSLVGQLTPLPLPQADLHSLLLIFIIKIRALSHFCYP
ncbi:hypothetical protein ACT691_07995 [Vibrio metschnikovii]